VSQAAPPADEADGETTNDVAFEKTLLLKVYCPSGSWVWVSRWRVVRFAPYHYFWIDDTAVPDVVVADAAAAKSVTMAGRPCVVAVSHGVLKSSWTPSSLEVGADAAVVVAGRSSFDGISRDVRGQSLHPPPLQEDGDNDDA